MALFLVMVLLLFFGSRLASFQNVFFDFYLKLFTYFTFVLFGICGFIPKKNSKSNSSKSSFLNKLSNLKLSSVLVVAISIFIGEIGDKTFLASLGLGVQYPSFKFSLILGSIFGMILSNLIAICFGKFLNSKFNQHFIEILSNIMFILFGIIGFISIIYV